MTGGPGLGAVDAVLVWNPNPTLDVVNVVDSLLPGHVHRASRQLISAGGKGTLVIRGLRQLGTPCLGVAPLAGPTGDVVHELLRRESLPFEVTKVSGATRLAISVAEEVDSRDTVINGPGPDVADVAWARHIATLMEHIGTRMYRYLVVAGRPPLTVPADELGKILRHAKVAGLRTVCDLASPFLETCVAAQPWLVKINMLEARESVGEDLSGPILVSRLLAAGAENVILTDGPGKVDGSLFQSRFAVIPPQVPVVAAVGCGDSFLAGLLSQLAVRQPDLGLIVSTAVAVASASAMHPQPGYFAPGHAAELMSEIHVDEWE